MVVLLVAFMSGMLSVLTPCVLPLLPAILASTATGGRRRPIGIVIGLSVSFTVALIAFSAIVRALGIPSGTLRWAAAVLLIAFGAILIVPALERWFEQGAGRLSRLAPSGRSGRDGLWSGIAIGGGLGIVWAPCVGPILAGVAVAASTAATTGEHIARAIAFAAGMSIPLLGIVFGGRRAAGALRGRINPRRVQLVAGAIFVATGAMIAAGLDTKVNTYLARVTGISSTLIADLEEKVLRDKETAPRFSSSGDDSDLPYLGTAPDFSGITQWINTPDEAALDMDELRGKVVLVDFWTYSCINCLRTLPYLRSWHDKYADEGLVIVGVHAPEFEFEKDEANVRDAIAENEIEYPVAMDNDFTTWRSYDNRYWPAKYLVDRDGEVRYTHFGEGEYEATERFIRELLRLEADDAAITDDTSDANLAETRETYVGYERAENFLGRQQQDVQATYPPAPARLDPDQWTLSGTWKVEGERAVAGANASITIHYRAADAFLVLGPADGDGGTVTVRDTAPDASERSFDVDAQQLYVLREGDTAQDATMTIEVPAGVAAYAFTFG